MNLFDKDAISIDVGKRLAQLRTEQNLSQRALARLSEISPNALNLIEQGKTSPTLSTLYKIADGLEVPVTVFFQIEDHKTHDVVYIKSSERTRVPFTRGVWEGLGGEAFSDRVEPFVLTLEVGGNSGPYHIKHDGHEFVLCLRGTLEYEIRDKKYLLEPGDSLLFSAKMEHRWRNIGKVVVNVLFVLSGYERTGPGHPHLPADTND
ncbi:MAG: cupin domain-containing protein [Anaerolineaceae bacterium]|nr:cupin domain-containing protein [Anaerolineaceae bacterium]